MSRNGVYLDNIQSFHGIGDAVLVDTEETYTVDPVDFAGKSHNTPYGGMELTGRVLATIKAGRFTYRDSRI